MSETERIVLIIFALLVSAILLHLFGEWIVAKKQLKEDIKRRQEYFKSFYDYYLKVCYLYEVEPIEKPNYNQMRQHINELKWK